MSEFGILLDPEDHSKGSPSSRRLVSFVVSESRKNSLGSKNMRYSCFALIFLQKRIHLLTFFMCSNDSRSCKSCKNLKPMFISPQTTFSTPYYYACTPQMGIHQLVCVDDMVATAWIKLINIEKLDCTPPLEKLQQKMTENCS